MQIEHTCNRCRRVWSTVHIQGGHPTLIDHAFGFSSPALCIRCHGWVYPVRDDEVLPYEFRPEARRILRASLWSAAIVTLMFSVIGLALRQPLTEATLPALYPPWMLKYLGIAAGLGFMMSWVVARIPKPMGLDKPHRRGGPPPAEMLAVAPLFIPWTLVVVAFFVWALPRLADENLRGTWVRLGFGVAAAVLTLPHVARQVFKHGRRPPRHR
ncbi:MAG: hypothetical protein IPK33_22110 [Gemmatimonadetes bacterium]|nr:hypothetical protein [Gemmatimonadota bacterium]